MKLSNQPIRIKLDVSPLKNRHQIRGIGVYTRLLKNHLEKIPEIELIKAGSGQPRPDVTHFPFFDLFFSTLPFKPWNKVVVTIHDVIPLVLEELYSVGKRGRLALKKQLLKLKSVSAIITDSHVSAKDIHTYLGIGEEKIHVIPLAGQPEIQKTSQAAVQKVKQQHNITGRYCLYVGDINPNKNLPQLIKMLKFVSTNINLVLVGKAFTPTAIPEWKAIETQIALSDVAQRVVFVPNIAANDFTSLSALYTGAVCYIQPSLYEGFGLPPLEAIQCETPVIASNLGSLPEILGSAVIYSQPTAEALADQLNTVLTLTAVQREKLITTQTKQIEQYNWQQTAKNTEAVYRKVLGL